MKLIKLMLLKVLTLFLALSCYSQQHPFLIVKESQYQALRDKANSNQQPFKMFKNVSLQRWNLAYASSNNQDFLVNVSRVVNYNIMAYIIDPANKARYKDKLLEIIGTGNRQLQAIETNVNHGLFIAGTSALFNQIIALDIIYPDLNNSQRQTAENNIGRSVNWYRDNGGSRAWRLSVDGINLLWALYRSNQTDINYWKDRYDYYLFDHSMTNDGSWGQSPGYVYARMHGERISKFGCIDVMQHMGIQNYYNDPRMKQLFQWAASFAVTPSGSYSKFGDTINNEYQLNKGTNMHYASVYGPTIGGMFRWNNNGNGNINGPQSFQGTNYMILILRKLNQDAAIMPTSILKEQSGGALWDRTDSREALQGIVYSLKRDNPNESQFGHTMEDINSIDISAYGQHMITNAGGLYVGKNNSGSNYPGYTPANDRWFLSKYQNTVLIGGRTTHNQRHGGGLTDGLVGGNIEFATTAAGPAINNGSHLRTLSFIHPEANKSHGYFVVHDEVKPNISSDRVDIQFQMNTKRNGTKVIKGNEEYEAPINGFIYDSFNSHDNTEKVSLFFTSNPNVNIVDSYKGIKRSVADRKTDNVRAEYKAKSDGYVRATTVIFPQDSKHTKPGISKISNQNYDGAIVSHSSSFKDYYIGASPSTTNTYSNISFKASTTFFRKEAGNTTKFCSTNGTIFRDTEGIDYGYQASKPVSIVLENNAGNIYAKSSASVTFYKKNITGVKVNGGNATVVSGRANEVIVSIPAGRHKIELTFGGTLPPPPTTDQAPFGGTPRTIPGTIEAEAYDTGGQGVAYNDSDVANNGPNVARENEGVDIEARDGGQTIGWTANGEWLEYTVNATAGSYDIEARVATVSTGKSIVAKLDGLTLGTFNLPNTGNWTTFQTINIPNVFITGGNNKVLRLEFVGGGVNLNWVKFNLNVPPQAPFGGTPRTIPGTVEAEAYDTGGQGVAYNDSDVVNNGPNVARENEGVDIEARDGGQTIGWTANGEWVEYTVNATAGTYNMEARVATVSTGKSIVVKLDGVTLSTFNLPNTGGWTTFQTINVPNVAVTGGNNKVLRLEFVGGGVNLNWVKFTAVNIPPTVSYLRPTTTDTFKVGDNLTVEANAADTDGTITSVELFFDNQPVNKSGQTDTHIWWSRYDVLMTNLQAGEHTLRLVATDNLGATTEAIRTISVEAIAPPANTQLPYGGTAQIIPGTVELEAYDTGGQGVAYNDSDVVNKGPNVARENEGVDIEARDGGQTIGWTASGEWIEYTINATAGAYDMQARVATVSTGKSIAVKLDGVTLGTFNLPNTQGWNTFQTVTVPNVAVTGGNNKILRLEFVGGGANINWIKFTPANASPTVSYKQPTTNVFKVGNNLTVEANAADADGSIASVELFFDNQPVNKSGQTNTHIWWSKYDVLMTNLQAGDHTLRLVATDNLGATTEAIRTISVGTNALRIGSIVSKSGTTTPRIYPNPVTNGNFTIDLGNNSSDSNISIVDIQGKVLYQTQTNEGSINLGNAELGNIASGMYFVKIEQGDNSKTQKILVE